MPLTQTSEDSMIHGGVRSPPAALRFSLRPLKAPSDYHRDRRFPSLTSARVGFTVCRGLFRPTFCCLSVTALTWYVQCSAFVTSAVAGAHFFRSERCPGERETVYSVCHSASADDVGQNRRCPSRFAGHRLAYLSIVTLALAWRMAPCQVPTVRFERSPESATQPMPVPDSASAVASPAAIGHTWTAGGARPLSASLAGRRLGVAEAEARSSSASLTRP
jgi:hypothetical protein